ncbi:MAG: hypothetical protein SVY53_01280 [Chloroflexota bacterium]|nr:hypothetical protein [Chloroflexota bacterium]
MDFSRFRELEARNVMTVVVEVHDRGVVNPAAIRSLLDALP